MSPRCRFEPAPGTPTRVSVDVALAAAARSRWPRRPPHEQARADATHALAAARRSSTPLALGYVLAVCGDTLLDHGDAAGAALLEEARSVLDRCSDPGIAVRYLVRAESRHGTAIAPPDPVAGMVEQLTDRELAVLRYLPSGQSQRDIARELFVSTNTVRTHCRAIYRKLGVGDRHAAVQAARDTQIL